MKLKVKKGDKVQILAGKDKGKTGIIEHVLPKSRAVVVTGLNLVKKHTRARKGTAQGGIITFPAPLPISRVMVVCPNCQKSTRVAITIDQAGNHLRTCRHCQEVLNQKEA